MREETKFVKNGNLLKVWKSKTPKNETIPEIKKGQKKPTGTYPNNPEEMKKIWKKCQKGVKRGKSKNVQKEMHSVPPCNLCILCAWFINCSKKRKKHCALQLANIVSENIFLGESNSTNTCMQCMCLCTALVLFFAVFASKTQRSTFLFPPLQG